MSKDPDAGVEEDTKKIDAAIKRRKLPDSVYRYHLEFGRDGNDDRIVTIWLVIDDDPKPTQRDINQTVRFLREGEHDLINLGLKHWPYFRFSFASEAERFL